MQRVFISPKWVKSGQVLEINSIFTFYFCSGMFNILEADIEQISQLMQFAEAMLEYHRQCSEILQGLSETLYTKTQAASGRQRREFVPKTLEVNYSSQVLNFSQLFIFQDLGIETSCDLSMTAPHLERQLRGSSSNR